MEFKPTEIEDKILYKVQDCVNLINSRLKMSQFKFPNVEFNLDGIVLGNASYKDWTVRFNLKFAKHNPEEFLKVTVPHEIAHLLDYHLYKKWGHGKTWKMIMRIFFNLEPKACSNMDLPPDVKVKKNRMNTFIYVCACPGKVFEIGMRKHNLISGGRKFSCVRCRTRIQYKTYIGKV